MTPPWTQAERTAASHSEGLFGGLLPGVVAVLVGCVLRFFMLIVDISASHTGGRTDSQSHARVPGDGPGHCAGACANGAAAQGALLSIRHPRTTGQADPDVVARPGTLSARKRQECRAAFAAVEALRQVLAGMLAGMEAGQ